MIKNKFVKFVHTKKSAIGIFLLCFALFCVLWIYLGNGLSIKLSNIDRYKSADITEVTYTSGPTSSETFANLNGRIFLQKDEKNISADVFMCLDGIWYSNNLLGYIGESTVGDGCFVSENLMRKYNLSVGDRLSIFKLDFPITIKGVLKAQNGFDEKYLHEGVVILQYNKNITSDKINNYLSFHREAGAYFGVERLIIVEDEIKGNQSQLAKLLCIMIFCSFVVAIIGELLSRQLRKHYMLNCKYGQKAIKTFVIILTDNVLKYVLTHICAWAVSLVTNSFFIDTFFVAGAIICALQLLLSFLIASIYMVGVKKWTKK